MQIESNRKQTALENTLRKHDRVAHAENSRQLSLPGAGWTRKYNEYNLLPLQSGDDGCRCCYDPNVDGGEYELLAEAKRDRGVAVADAVDGHGFNEQNHDTNNKSDSEEDSDDEFDYLLDEDLPSTSSHDVDDLQSQRRIELQNQAYHYQVAKYHGYGVHRQISPQRVFTAAGYGANHKRDVVCPKGSVIHLYDPYSPLSVSLDICLEDMSRRYPGTKFVRGIGIASVHHAEGGSNDDWKRDDLPMLLAIRNADVVAWSSGLRDFYRDGNEEIESRVVEQFLENAGVLETELPSMDTLCRIRPEEEVLLENMRRLNGLGRGQYDGGILGGMRGENMGRKYDEETFEEEEHQQQQQERYECGVAGCCKSFFHEHVGLKTEAQDGLLVSESDVVS